MAARNDPFAGEGEVRALGRSLDWGATPLGPVDGWPRILRDTVRTCLASPFPINLWCGRELVLIYNDAYRRVLGAKHPASLGRPGPEVWAEIWPQIEPMFEGIRAGGPPIYQEDAPFYVHRAEQPPEARAPGADEDAGAAPNAWFTFSLSPVRSADGEIVAFLNVVSESTRRVLAERAREAARAEAERAEARLRDVFSQAPAFMALLRGPDHVFEYVNTAYYQLVGHRELVGRPVFEALPEVRGQGFERLLDDVLETGDPFVGREVPVVVSRTPDSPPEERFLDLVYYPITEADGTRSGVVVHGADVTEHVWARREAQRARTEAERANLAKSQFLATMSHEIRTPINAAMGYADLLDAGVSGSLSATQQRYVDGIRASSRHLLGLVSDILDLAKIEAGEMEVRTEEVAIRTAVTSAIHLVAPQADRSGLRLEERWECSPDVRVLGDPDSIRQVLLNLLSNAIKFTRPGGTVSVHCRVSEAAAPEAALPELGPWVVLDVEDTGRGIAPDQLARVFEPFVQVEAGHTRRAGGTGLGLTISRRLARFMGGELTVQSRVGEGSRFSLWLATADQERVPSSTGAAAGASTAWPPEPHERRGLGSAGRTLLACVAWVEEEWVERIRNDPHMGTAERADGVQLASQVAQLTAAFGSSLTALEDGGSDLGLLDDAQAIQTVIARKHGLQRRRLGWSRGELEREYQLLEDVLDGLLRRETPKRTVADLGTALNVMHRLVARARDTSTAAYEGEGAT